MRWKISLMSCGVRRGLACSQSAMMPATTGADMDVPLQAKCEANGNSITFTDTKGKSFTFEIDPNQISAGDTIKLDLNHIGAFTVQVGANEGELLDMRIPEISLHSLGLDKLEVTTQDDAREGIDIIKDAIDKVSQVRSRIGAYQNRLEHTAASLAVTEENMTAAESGIMDLDMSEAMVGYTTQQVLVQAGTSMLSQANQQPEQALQLLQ